METVKVLGGKPSAVVRQAATVLLSHGPRGKELGRRSPPGGASPRGAVEVIASPGLGAGRGFHYERGGITRVVKSGKAAGPAVNCSRPSVDVLFRSVAGVAGRDAFGIIGTADEGTGRIAEMHQAGALTVIRDEETCVVWGMAGEAVKRGTDVQPPLDGIAREIARYGV